MLSVADVRAVAQKELKGSVLPLIELAVYILRDLEFSKDEEDERFFLRSYEKNKRKIVNYIVRLQERLEFEEDDDASARVRSMVFNTILQYLSRSAFVVDSPTKEQASFYKGSAQRMIRIINYLTSLEKVPEARENADGFILPQEVLRETSSEDAAMLTMEDASVDADRVMFTTETVHALTSSGYFALEQVDDGTGKISSYFIKFSPTFIPKGSGYYFLDIGMKKESPFSNLATVGKLQVEGVKVKLLELSDSLDENTKEALVKKIRDILPEQADLILAPASVRRIYAEITDTLDEDPLKALAEFEKPEGPDMEISSVLLLALWASKEGVDLKDPVARQALRKGFEFIREAEEVFGKGDADRVVVPLAVVRQIFAGITYTSFTSFKNSFKDLDSYEKAFENALKVLDAYEKGMADEPRIHDEMVTNLLHLAYMEGIDLEDRAVRRALRKGFEFIMEAEKASQKGGADQAMLSAQDNLKTALQSFKGFVFHGSNGRDYVFGTMVKILGGVFGGQFEVTEWTFLLHSNVQKIVPTALCPAGGDAS